MRSSVSRRCGSGFLNRSVSAGQPPNSAAPPTARIFAHLTAELGPSMPAHQQLAALSSEDTLPPDRTC